MRAAATVGQILMSRDAPVKPSTGMTAGAPAASRSETPSAAACFQQVTIACTPAQSQNVVAVMSTTSTRAPLLMAESKHFKISSALVTSTSTGTEMTAARPTQSTG